MDDINAVTLAMLIFRAEGNCLDVQQLAHVIADRCLTTADAYRFKVIAQTGFDPGAS